MQKKIVLKYKKIQSHKIVGFLFYALFICTDMTTKAKVIRVLSNTAKIVGAITLLYFFICSLDLLSSAFRLISGKTAGNNKIFHCKKTGMSYIKT